jgi:hypothetical protein
MTLVDAFMPWLVMFGGIVVVAVLVARRGR